MVKSYLKSNIRMDKISIRNNKPHYKHLDDKQKRFVKVMEKVKQCEMEIGKLDMQIPNWRKEDYGQQLLQEYMKAVDKQIVLSNELDITELEENRLFTSCHTSRFYGGSF